MLLEDTQRIALINRSLVALSALLLLQACGSSEEEDSASTQDPIAGETEYDVELVGSVGDGPIVNASLLVRANDGTVLENSVSGDDAGYNIQLRTKGKYYPLTIDASGGVDLATQTAPGFTLISASTAPSKKSVANINPFTTLAILIARKMNGGLSSNNISSALSIVTTQFNAGMTSALSLDPMSIQIDDSNLAEIVKASEALAEIFRRVRSAAGQSGMSLDAVIDAIASDLVDGTLDGRGAAGTNRRVTAATIVVSSGVMLESMVNRLEVGGQNVTSTLDDIIRQLASGNNPPLTDSRPVTSHMIAQARRGIDAAIALNDTAALQTLASALNDVTAGMMSDGAAQVLPMDPSLALEPMQLTLATASDAQVDAVIAADSPSAPSPSGNSVPQISGTPATSVLQDSAYSFIPTASDADGDPLGFTASGLPSWANFNATSGAIAGTPTASDVGVYSGITITVTDGMATASLGPFSITVESSSTPPPPAPGNVPPVISGSPGTSVMQDTAYAFRPTASDADGDPLSFSVTGLPSWASFSAGTGRLAGTPTGSDVGTYSGITISVSDGMATASLGPFSITVEAAPAPVNTPPVISGSPASSVMQDSAYAFTPTASDADGDSINFSVTALPSWASFSAGSGTIAGTPTAADIGTYNGIAITVTDGLDSATLGPFSITVQAAALGSATLSWVAPTENTDGTPLTNLAGFKVYWGRQSGNYSNSTTIMNAGISNYVVDQLTSGTWYFTVTALNDQSEESSFSNEASKTIN